VLGGGVEVSEEGGVVDVSEEGVVVVASSANATETGLA
jgi:hypothetical protein